jgi:hypothetical protein
MTGSLMTLTTISPSFAGDSAGTAAPKPKTRRVSSTGSTPIVSRQATKPLPPVSLLDAMREGKVEVSATGIGDGRMTLSVTNRTRGKLRVVLPPGLIASGASGQFGGMGGMGGGMGRMGGMGGMGMGGMGGMRGGMGGMGGGMGRGRMGGGRGGMRGGGTMPPMMGMMMLGRLIMTLVGDKDSRDMTSLMSGMMGMRGGMMGGMGGGMMGGGMGGMGMGGMMGGMGGGFRSVPPTGLPEATLKVNQTRHLPTRVVSLAGPNAAGKAILPAKDEPLVIRDFNQVCRDPWSRVALHHIAEDKAPPVIAQLVMWHVYNGLSWPTIETISKGWANDFERTVARDYVNRLRQANDPFALSEDECGSVYFELTSRRPADDPLQKELHDALIGRTILGLKGRDGVPINPKSPGVAVRIRLDEKLARIQYSSTHAKDNAWLPLGKLELPLLREDKTPRPAAELADTLAESLLGRLVDATLIEKSEKGKTSYSLRIDNASPLILNGLALSGTTEESANAVPSSLAGLTLPPHRSIAMPASPEMVQRLGLKHGVKPIAADLSSL